MDPQILLIKMSEEAHQWDEMVLRVERYLLSKREEKLSLRNTILTETNKNLMKQKTKKEWTHGIQTKSKQEIERERKLKETFAGKNDAARVFNAEELELIACAFKSQLQEDRKAIKDIDILMKKGKFETKKGILELYKNGLRKNMIDHAMRQIKIIEECCIPVVGAKIPMIFFMKILGDIYRYITEISVATDYQDYKLKAENMYTTAREYYKMLTHERVSMQIGGNKDGEVIESLRLSLNLNYAIFLFEFKDEKKKALRLLKKEIQEALDDFDKWDQTQIDQIKQQVELIQENINIWKKDVDTDSEEEN